MRSNHRTASSGERREAEARGEGAQKKEKTAGEDGEGEIREWERR